jgi:predicted ArsR family transcriptional regulator
MDLPLAVTSSDVLAQPTRARLFALMGEIKEPVGTSDLAERLGLHSNGARFHLERMEAAGLVVRTRARQARGRPRDAWAIAPDARPGGEPPSAYAALSRWLARAIPPGPGRLRAVEAAGRDIGRELAPPDASGPDGLQSTLAALGFHPRAKAGARGRLTYRLENCPYRDAVRENQSVVCTLHRGMTRGLLDALDPAAELTGFVPRDPDRAGCLIKLAGVSKQDG